MWWVSGKKSFILKRAHLNHDLLDWTFYYLIDFKVRISLAVSDEWGEQQMSQISIVMNNSLGILTTF